MSFANHNILDIALSIIPPTVVQIRKNEGTVVNKYGQSEASYSEWIDVYGIVQPGAEQNQHTQGVDFSKKRVTIWLRGISLDGTHIQWAPDQIRYVGAIYNVVGVKDWYPYDNYKECECVEAMNLGANQRGALPESANVSQKPVSRTKESDNQQMLSFDTPPSSRLSSASTPTTDTATAAEEEKPTLPTRKPSIFVPDEKPQVEQPTAPMPKPKPSLVGKARIRF